MARMLAKYPVSMLYEGYNKAWELGILRYYELQDRDLELCDTRQKAEENLNKARQLDNEKREKKRIKGAVNQDAHLFRTVKEVWRGRSRTGGKGEDMKKRRLSLRKSF